MYGKRTGGMGGSKKAKILRTYYVHSPNAQKKRGPLAYANKNTNGMQITKYHALGSSQNLLPIDSTRAHKGVVFSCQGSYFFERNATLAISDMP